MYTKFSRVFLLYSPFREFSPKFKFFTFSCSPVTDGEAEQGELGEDAEGEQAAAPGDWPSQAAADGGQTVQGHHPGTQQI